MKNTAQKLLESWGGSPHKAEHGYTKSFTKKGPGRKPAHKFKGDSRNG
jgi:hypothetical protein